MPTLNAAYFSTHIVNPDFWPRNFGCSLALFLGPVAQARACMANELELLTLFLVGTTTHVISIFHLITASILAEKVFRHRSRTPHAPTISAV